MQMSDRVRASFRVAATIMVAVTALACDELRDGTGPLPIGSSLVVSPVADTIFVSDTITDGDSVRLTALARTFSGDSVVLTGIEWESGNTQVAVVDSTGLVTARGVGEVTITAIAGERATARIVIVPATAALVLVPAIDTLVLGDSLQLFAQAYDANGDPVVGVRYDFTSGDTLVATIDSLGLVRAVGAGDARVTASAAGRQAFSDITVIDTIP